MVIVFGGNGYNTLGCIRCLGYFSIPFVLVLVSKSIWNPVLNSRFVHKYYKVGTDEEGFNLIKKYRKEWNGSVILPTSDSAESVLDTNYDLLSASYIFPNAGKSGSVNKLMRKEIQVQFAKKAGISVPSTFNYHRGELLPKSIVYPCIVKQERSICGHKALMRICHDEHELRNELASIVDTDEILIQQYIKKDFELLLIGCSLPNGIIWIPGVFKKERWYQSGDDASYGFISTDVGSYYPHIDNVKSLITDMGYFGPFSIEFGVMNNIPYFYEVNFRNDGTSHYFHKAGIFIPYIYYIANISQNNFKIAEIRSNTYTFIDEFGDLRNLCKPYLSLKQWIFDIKHAEAYKYFNKSDIKPFLAFAPRRFLATIFKTIVENVRHG